MPDFALQTNNTNADVQALSWQKISVPSSGVTTELWCAQLSSAVPLCAGNKWLKLKYHIQHIQQYEKTGIITFGGAYSNHLAAVAAAGNHFNFQTHAMVRQQHGALTPTLAYCQAQGMRLEFVSAQQYRCYREVDSLRALAHQYPCWAIVPEGGTSALGVTGVQELTLAETPSGKADLIVVACGSGGTTAGLCLGHPEIPVLAIAVVKDHGLPDKLSLLTGGTPPMLWQEHENLRYGKFNQAILQTCEWVAKQGIAIEPIYTGKALHSMLVWLKQGRLQQYRRIVFFHTGGLQGLAGLLQQGLISPAQYALFSLKT